MLDHKSPVVGIFDWFCLGVGIGVAAWPVGVGRRKNLHVRRGESTVVIVGDFFGTAARSRQQHHDAQGDDDAAQHDPQCNARVATIAGGRAITRSTAVDTSRCAYVSSAACDGPWELLRPHVMPKSMPPGSRKANVGQLAGPAHSAGLARLTGWAPGGGAAIEHPTSQLGATALARLTAPAVAAKVALIRTFVSARCSVVTQGGPAVVDGGCQHVDDRVS